MLIQNFLEQALVPLIHSLLHVLEACPGIHMVCLLKYEVNIRKNWNITSSSIRGDIKIGWQQ